MGWFFSPFPKHTVCSNSAANTGHAVHSRTDEKAPGNKGRPQSEGRAGGLPLTLARETLEGDRIRSRMREN